MVGFCRGIRIISIRQITRAEDAPVLDAPALNEGDPDGAHPGEVVDSLEPPGNAVAQLVCKLLVVEDLNVAACNTTTIALYQQSPWKMSLILLWY